MGFVRKRSSRTEGTRYQAVAQSDGRRVQLGSFETFALGTDGWQHVGTTSRRVGGGSGRLAGRRAFA